MHADSQRGLVFWQITVIVLVGVVLAVLLLARIHRMAQREQQARIQGRLVEIARSLASYHDRYGSYTTDFQLLDWIPEGSPRYVYGFAASYYPPDAPPAPGYLSYTGYVEVENDLRGVWDHSREVNHQKMYLNQRDLILEHEGRRLIPQASEDRFLLVAVGNLDDDPALDLWCIDHMWNLKHVYDDSTDKFLGMPPLEGFVQDLEALLKSSRRSYLPRPPSEGGAAKGGS